MLLLTTMEQAIQRLKTGVLPRSLGCVWFQWRYFLAMTMHSRKSFKEPQSSLTPEVQFSDIIQLEQILYHAHAHGVHKLGIARSDNDMLNSKPYFTPARDGFIQNRLTVWLFNILLSFKMPMQYQLCPGLFDLNRSMNPFNK